MMTLSVDAVRAFVMIADLQSFTRAADELGSTQGALSVQLKRLEQKLGHQLIVRTPRYVRLSRHGALFIGPARDFLAAHALAIRSLTQPRRQLKLGIAAHVLGPEIPRLLGRLQALDPALLLEIKLDCPQTLLALYEADALNTLIIRHEDDDRSGTVLCSEPFGWYAAPSFRHHGPDPLPLANQAPDCGIRKMAAQALDEAHISWQELLVGGGPSMVDATVAAGLAIGLFPCRLVPPELIEVGSSLGLPIVPSSTVVMHSTLSDPQSLDILRLISSAFKS
ncbi:MAG: LysR family transcriptional regulator [Neisseriaceae bacterium]|nr:LysR family transcriptional regulator [Neisseriaceae bacterium]